MDVVGKYTWLNVMPGSYRTWPRGISTDSSCGCHLFWMDSGSAASNWFFIGSLESVFIVGRRGHASSLRSRATRSSANAEEYLFSFPSLSLFESRCRSALAGYSEVSPADRQNQKYPPTESHSIIVVTELQAYVESSVFTCRDDPLFDRGGPCGGVHRMPISSGVPACTSMSRRWSALTGRWA